MACPSTSRRVVLGSVYWATSSSRCGIGAPEQWRHSLTQLRSTAGAPGYDTTIDSNSDVYSGPCVVVDTPAWDSEWVHIYALIENYRAFGRALIIANRIDSLTTNERLSDIQVARIGTASNGRDEYSALIETFTCPTGEEPPPWGQPPYDEPGSPGSCEYATSLKCEQPNQTWLALAVDSGGQPLIVDCDVAPFDYCHAPCDSTFGPPAASVRLPPNATEAQRKDAVNNLIRLHYLGLEAAFAALECPWPPPSGGDGGVPPLDSPVTLHFGESLIGVFADPTVDATFFQLVDLPVGSRYALGDQISSDDWYAFAVRDKSISGGLVTYAGETLLATLGRVTPTESLILVAGQGGVPTPLTLRECLVRFLTYYGVPFDPNVPEFSLRVGDELVTPTADAFVIQPNQENPESLYEWLERFFGPFRGYTFRADYQDRLSVSPPAWLDTIGLRLTVHRRRQPLDREPVRSTVRAPWSTTRAPTVEWVGTVDGVAVSGSLPDPLVQGAGAEIVTVGGVDVRLTWDAAVVQAMVWPTPDLDVSVGSLYSVTFVFRPDATTSSRETLTLTVSDLAPDEVTSESADTVVNQAVLPVRRREFTPAQQVMQAGALVLRSPKQVMAGAFGANPEYGPLAEPLATPGSFLELANTVGQSGTWFWPADPLVVAQPGGNITVAFEVEEWAERWHDPTSHDAAAQVNTYSGSAALPASGQEVKLFDFQFPRQTNDFAPSPYGAQGTVYGRWRAGEQPGIEVRVGNARFAEFGFKPEVLIFGSTTYYLWGIVLKLNGTGTAFTEGTLETYRFGFARGANGLWEDDANVPGLSESQTLYPNRVYHAPELPYVVSAETALALARGIVEENLTPKVVRQLTIVPARADGYAVRPHHVGRAAAVPALGITGRITALDYSEAHTAQGSTSSLTIDVESTEAPSGSRAAARAYRRSAYGLSTYQLED